MKDQKSVTVDPYRLEEFCSRVLVAAGLPQTEAVVVAESLVAADLCGVGSHGVSRISDYLGRLDDGLIERRTRLEIVSETSTTALLDAGNGWGQVASARAVELAIGKAREHGSAWVGVRNSNHNGTGRYWVSRIAEAGMVGIAATNGSPVMAPFGSREPSLGTNPIAMGAPTRSGAPVVLDMATSSQARGKILLAAKNGEPIPEGWALTADGAPTTDAKQAWDGVLLPMAGPKGSGLAMMIDVLAGVLTGARFGAHMPRMYADPEPQRLGHFFAAVDIAAMTPMEEFLDRMHMREHETRDSAPAEGFTEVLMPGDVENRRASHRASAGIRLSPAIHEELLTTARRYGVHQMLAV
ncbi:Ldh family oxidoreductase [Pseudonocardia kunmingensis]|uniref:LDH2 family malate/lactate/ureidoglycolate dehydrogenase n=1 Tax=Pseudonocardia kunmingensis TaxID=630975 RepID=A0A543DVN8_9PSEU|nr:Ldh family oxidoreductase [Pseudonocardia kunmingensis]TQM13385.1 LDH2 family malate/lactate/ureidoglycolate dehydrogenase [Pseudonocardia kunmingensis]